MVDSDSGIAEGHARMEVAGSHTARWFVSLFHQYSVSIEHWRSVAEAKTSAAIQLQQKVAVLEKEIREVGCNQAVQAEVIESHLRTIYSLECDIQRQKQGSITPYDASLAAEHQIRAHTPYQRSASTSYSPSDFISARPPSFSEVPSLKGADGDGQNAEASGGR
jgi:hypothetical protein